MLFFKSYFDVQDIEYNVELNGVNSFFSYDYKEITPNIPLFQMLFVIAIVKYNPLSG